MFPLHLFLQPTEVWLLPHNWDCSLLSRFLMFFLMLNQWTNLNSSIKNSVPHWIFFQHSQLLQTRSCKSNPLSSMVFHFPYVSSCYECLVFFGRLFFLYLLYKLWCPPRINLSFFLSLYSLFLVSLTPCMSSALTIWYWAPKMYVFNPYFFSEL